jgi:hypothetical protein
LNDSPGIRLFLMAEIRKHYQTRHNRAPCRKCGADAAKGGREWCVKCLGRELAAIVGEDAARAYALACRDERRAWEKIMENAK